MEIACNLCALTPDQRTREQALLADVRASTRDLRELPDGYALLLDLAPAAVLEFITLERLCCPFLTLHFEAPWLHITGAKAFVRATFTPSSTP